MSTGQPARKKQRRDPPTDQEPEVDTQDATERACDSCRTRRVKCDRTTPCANCRRRGETCHTTVLAATEPRARGFLTKAYEKKIDLMTDRLESMERLLQQQQATLASIAQSHVPTTRQPMERRIPSTVTATALPSPESQAAVATDQDSSDATTTSHSTAARKLVEKAVEGSATVYQDFELREALNSLKDMVGRSDDDAFFLNDVESSWRPLLSGSEAIDPPSAAEIAQLLDGAHGSITLGFTPGLTAEVLREKCEDVFGGTRIASPIRRAYVLGTLRTLCVEYGGQHDDAAFAKRCRDLSAYFSVQLGHVVENLKLIIPTTAEAASTLTLASGAAMELCRPLVAQLLSSKAASIVLSLGYNRLSTMRSDSEKVRQVKIFTFWMAYWLDTSFSVRLGRAPIIRPHDIAVPQLSEDSIIPKGWVVAFNYSTRISGLQCKVVEELYTPLAIQQSLEERKSRASQLVDELEEAWKARGPGPTSVALWKDSDAVMHHSTIALVQHATMSADSSESPALWSARQALMLNIQAWETHKNLPDFIWSGHCHWTLLKGPITPFVVTFCHIVAHPFAAVDDLQLLTDFVRTLEQLRRFSDGMIRLHKLCDIFTKVATLYVQAKANEAHPLVNNEAIDPAYGWVGQPAVQDIDEYLSTIGFAPPPMNHLNGVNSGLEDLPGFNPNFLMDWYQGNNSLMGFLEQDLMVTGEQGLDFSLDPSV